MATASAGSQGSSATFTVTATASRSGKRVSITCPWTLASPWISGYGGAYYAAGKIAGSVAASKTDTSKGGFTLTGSKTLTYDDPAARTFSIKIQCGCQGNKSTLTSWGSEVTLSVSVAAATFTLTFDPGEGSTPTPSKTVTYGGTYGTLPTPTRSGYAFAGWYTAAEGGEEITAGDTVAITENTTLYAHWENAIGGLRVAENGAVSRVSEVWVVENGSPAQAKQAVLVIDGTVQE